MTTTAVRVGLRERAKKALAESEAQARRELEQYDALAREQAVSELRNLLDLALGLDLLSLGEVEVKRVATYCGGVGAYVAVVEIDGVRLMTDSSTNSPHLGVEMPNGFPYTTAITCWADLGRVLRDIDEMAAQQ